MAMFALLLVLLFVPGNFAQSVTPIEIVVVNSVQNQPNISYNTYVAYRGILIGGMTRLQASNDAFTFTTTEYIDYGPFLESVNGLAGNFSQNTYWELLVQTSDGNITRPDVGIGCYIPNANDQIILKYTTFESGNQSALVNASSPYDIYIAVLSNSNSAINYHTTVVAFRSILIGIMTRLQTSSNGNFSFTYTNNANYGPFLESVNGLAGSAVDETYWQLLVQASNGQITIPNVGIGCIIPNPNDQIILKYTSYGSGKDIFSRAPGLVVAPLLLFLSLSLAVSGLVPPLCC